MKSKIITSHDIFEACSRMSEAERQFEIIAPNLSWKMLAELEPQLDVLLSAARTADSACESEWFCGQRFWHRELKPEMLNFVGYSRRDFHPILGTSAAYDLVYDTLWKAVPDCRDCPWCK